MAQIVPTIKLRISGRPLIDRTNNPMASEDYEDPLVEVVSEEEVVNSTPAIKQAMREFAQRNNITTTIHIRRV